MIWYEVVVSVAGMIAARGAAVERGGREGEGVEGAPVAGRSPISPKHGKDAGFAHNPNTASEQQPLARKNKPPKNRAVRTSSMRSRVTAKCPD